ncbi:uncharacterized protein BJ212DRAFT_1267936 [Suillus subaureus]|uniref:Uncharacterized protein n=1 Tax=Suillus subaureus TaxID=48587 RepID=A0A9P7EEW5_9AGAM|nr:uncharacterized protein BJ212DRAFT_1267936 [Suillus subaureus]KAG1819657.1 hypothetical protein BJ212DRAFT_1267936 [Suillus subaureus]
MKLIQFAVLTVLAAVTGVKAAATDSNTGICILPCYPEETECVEGWYAAQFRDCWTCCTET